MTIQEVATILLNRQNAAFSFIVDGLTRAKLGSEGFQYARSRGWVELDEATQCTRVTMRQVKLAELHEAAASTTPASIKASAPVHERSSRVLDLVHMAEAAKAYSPNSLPSIAESSASEAELKPNPAWRAFELSTGRASYRLSEAAPGEDYKPGDQVVIGEDGEQYYATVQSKQPDGKLVLSFGDKKPSKVKPTYEPAEVSKTQAKPGTPAPAAPKPPVQPAPAAVPTVAGGPTAPGLGH